MFGRGEDGMGGKGLLAGVMVAVEIVDADDLRRCDW